MMNNLLKYIIIALMFILVFLIGEWLMQWLSTIKQKKLIKNDQPSSAVAFVNPRLKNLSELQKRMNKLIPITSTLGFILGFMIAGADPFSIRSYGLAFALAGLGLAGPKLLLVLIKQKRLKALAIQLPDCLELIVNSMKAGLSLTQSLEIAATETTAPINEELKKVVADSRLGLTAEETLERMWRRWPNPDLELFVVAASVTSRTGGNLVEVTSRLISAIRERVRLKGRIDALTSQGRLSGWVVGLLPIILLIALTWMEPELMNGFFKHPIGLLLLGSCVILEGLGAFFIAKIATINI